MPATSILWFRRDLRLDENPALQAASSDWARMIPVYIHAPDEENPWEPGAASNWWLHHSLTALDQNLARKGSRLLILRGDSLACLQHLIGQTGATGVYWNRCYEPASIARDRTIKQRLRSAGLTCASFNGRLLFEPWEIQTKSGQAFKVFTPYWRQCRARLQEIPAPQRAPERLPPLPQFLQTACAEHVGEQRLGTLGLLPNIPWDGEFPDHWQPGAAGAQARLQAFLDHAAARYASDRDLPAVAGTSGLSPHLHFGEISPREILAAVDPPGVDPDLGPETAADPFLRELGWREFSVQLLYHFPHTSDAPLNAKFADFPWRDPPPKTTETAWKQGQTGIPLVDAAMRELWRTGWMHNRVRMVVASFLTKNLLIPWQTGARWFWDTLVDADLANNTQGWQWTAGCGADAAPYYRIFNPVRQSERFDPHGRYIRRWCPELAQLPDRHIHQPAAAPSAILSGAGVRLGHSYPHPIVDLARSRNAALAAWQRLRGE